MHCPECGSKLRRKEIEGRERMACISCGYVFWKNPVPVVGSIIRYDGGVVLVRPKGRPRGFWALPAGFMEEGESAEEAAVREAKEETNLDTRIERIIGTYPIPREVKPLIYIAFVAEHTGGELRAGDDADDVCCVSYDEALLELRGTIAGRALERFLGDEKYK